MLADWSALRNELKLSTVPHFTASLGVNLRKLWEGSRPVNSESTGGNSGTLYGCYPFSAVGQTGLGNNTTDLLGPGPDGTVTTIRFEVAKESNQDAEARVVLEKALVVGKLPAPLAKECQELLDGRTTVLRLWEAAGGHVTRTDATVSRFTGGWRGSTFRLCEYASRAAEANGK